VTKARLARLADMGTTSVDQLWDEDANPTLRTLDRIARALTKATPDRPCRIADLFEEIAEIGVQSLNKRTREAVATV
jgi:transcriptional regulator with XRE-family HTH domain